MSWLSHLSDTSSARTFSLSQTCCTLTCLYTCSWHDLHAHRLPTIRCILLEASIISSVRRHVHALKLTTPLVSTYESCTVPPHLALHVMRVMIRARAISVKCSCYKLRVHIHLDMSFTRRMHTQQFDISLTHFMPKTFFLRYFSESLRTPLRAHMTFSRYVKFARIRHSLFWSKMARGRRTRMCHTMLSHHDSCIQ